jgi:hypothetical protein
MTTYGGSIRDLPELLMETGLDCRQVALITELPLLLVAGCQDVLDGGYLDADALRAFAPADREDYYRGQRIADAWFAEELADGYAEDMPPRRVRLTELGEALTATRRYYTGIDW